MLCPQTGIEGIGNMGNKYKGRAVDMAYLDFSKTFDVLP